MTAAGRRPALFAPMLAAWLLTASPVPAQTPAPPSTTLAPAPAARFGQPGVPYDVHADGSQIFQAEHKIVLTGRVEVVQGTSRMRSPRVTLFYNPSSQVKGQPAATGAAGPGAINRMEADGPVYFVTPTQSAKGDRGTYDGASDTMTLFGNVTVVQDNNVATGDKLTIQQKTGLVTLTSGSTSGRVRGVFYSNDKPGDKPAPKP